MTTALTTLNSDLTLPNAAAPPIAARRGPHRLRNRQKAAIIVRLLLAEGAQLSLRDLPEKLQAELTHQMSTMRFVDRVTLKSVIEEFVAEIEDVGLSFPKGVEGALSVLDGAISAATAARIRKLSGVQLIGDPWETIAALDPAQLLPVLESESVEVAAILLSKLKIATAAQLLGGLPGPRARQITFAVSQTGAIAPETVEKIGRSLAEQLDAQPVTAFADSPVERVGAILNFSPATTRDAVLDGLEQDDATFARDVRRTIFTFTNIPDRVDPRDVPKITRDVDQPTLITALTAASGADDPAAEFILGAMSKRMAESLREEMENLGKVKEKDGEAAMSAVITTIRTLESNGEIVLIVADEAETDDA